MFVVVVQCVCVCFWRCVRVCEVRCSDSQEVVVRCSVQLRAALVRHARARQYVHVFRPTIEGEAQHRVEHNYEWSSSHALFERTVRVRLTYGGRSKRLNCNFALLFARYVRRCRMAPFVSIWANEYTGAGVRDRPLLRVNCCVARTCK